MATLKADSPAQRKSPQRWTTREKVIVFWLLCFYLVMIAVTIATMPYFSNPVSRSIFQEPIEAF